MADTPFSLLLVDDSRSTAARLAQALGAPRYAARVVPASAQLPKLATEVDLVLLCLEHEDSLALLRQLLAVEGPGRGAPVIAVVAQPERALRLDALRLGAEVVSEPWDEEELHARLQRAFSMRRVLGALAAQVSELQQLSVLDGLTLLHNHRYFQERLREEFRVAQRYDDALCLILVDLDHFKQLNDTHGHPAGDDALRRVARSILRSVRETDVVARYGGDEFAVLLPRTPLTGAITVAERIWRELGLLRLGPDGTLRVTASLGLSVFPHRTVLSAEQLLLTADEALYRAKREGRNRVSLHSPVPLLARSP